MIGVAFGIWLLSTRNLEQAWFLPIVVVVGDYYMFGEIDPIRPEEGRLIRDFDDRGLIVLGVVPISLLLGVFSFALPHTPPPAKGRKASVGEILDEYQQIADYCRGHRMMWFASCCALKM